MELPRLEFDIPQVVIKVLKTARHNKVRDLLNYIARQNDDEKENIELETSDGFLLQTKEEIKELYNSWKLDFERKKKNAKTAPRHAVHIIFSADCQQKRKNILKFQDCVRDLIARNFNGYEYTFGIHQDANKPHVHLVVKCKSRKKSIGKLRINPDTLFLLRQEFAEELTKRGLAHSSILYKARPEIIKKNLFDKAPQKTLFQVKLKDIQQETAFLKAQYKKIESALKNADDFDKEKLFKKRDTLGERVNQLKRNIFERTTVNSVQRSQSFNIVRKLERELKRRDPAFRDIIKRADQLNSKNTKDYTFEPGKTDKTYLLLKESLNNLEKSFSKIEKENSSLKTKPSGYKDEVKFIGAQINQLKINVKKNTKEDTAERLYSFNAIRRLERDLKKRDPHFKKIIKMSGHLKIDNKYLKTSPEKKFTISKIKAEQMAFSLIEAKNIIKRLPDAKERKEAKKLLSDYTKVITKSSPQIKEIYKNIKKKETRLKKKVNKTIDAYPINFKTIRIRKK